MNISVFIECGYALNPVIEASALVSVRLCTSLQQLVFREQWFSYIIRS